MAILLGPHPILGDIVEALGLDRDRVISLDLRMATEEVVSVKAEMFVTSDQGESLLKVVKNYYLHAIEVHDPAGEGADHGKATEADGT